MIDVAHDGSISRRDVPEQFALRLEPSGIGASAAGCLLSRDSSSFPFVVPAGRTFSAAKARVEKPPMAPRKSRFSES